MMDSLDDALTKIEVYAVRFEELTTATKESAFVEAGFGVLNQSLKYLHLTSNLYTLERSEGLERNEAIVVGQLVRMCKLVHAILGKAQQERGGDQHSAIGRQFLEGLSIVEYLTQDISATAPFESYLQDGLIAEKEFDRTISDEVKKRRGKRWEVENRLNASIDNTFTSAGVDKTSLPGRKKNGFLNAQSRMDLIDSTMYGSYRAMSGGIHGTWNDIGNNHLKIINGKFHPDFEPCAIRPQIFTAMAIWGTRACLAYVEAYLPNYYIRVQPAMAEQMRTTFELDALHEQWLSARPPAE